MRVGIGVVIWGHKGDFFAEMSKRVADAYSMEMAELLVAQEAMGFTLEVGFKDIVLEGDNCSIMNAIRLNEYGLPVGKTMVALTRLRWNFRLLSNVKSIMWHMY